MYVISCKGVGGRGRIWREREVVDFFRTKNRKFLKEFFSRSVPLTLCFSAGTHLLQEKGFLTFSRGKLVSRNKFYKIQAEKPGVARGKKIINKWINIYIFEEKIFFTPHPPGYQWLSIKMFSTFGPAVWPAIRNIHTNALLYYTDFSKAMCVYYIFVYLYITVYWN